MIVEYCAWKYERCCRKKIKYWAEKLIDKTIVWCRIYMKYSAEKYTKYGA